MSIEFVDSWTRRRVIFEFSGFPRCIAQIVAEFCAIPQLLSWIDKSQINWYSLCKNPGAIESGMIDVRYANPNFLVVNPAASEYIKAHPEAFMKFGIWENPALFDWVVEQPRFIYERNYGIIGQNTNPNAIKYLIDLYGGKEHVLHTISKANPAIVLFWSQEEIIAMINDNNHTQSFYANPATIEFVKDKLDNAADFYLSSNSHPIAIEYLRTHQDKIDWVSFSANPGIFEYRPDARLVELLSS